MLLRNILFYLLLLYNKVHCYYFNLFAILAKGTVTLPADYAKKNIYQRVVAVNNHKSLFPDREYNWYSGPSELQLIHEATETAINDAAADAAAVEVARYAVDGTQLAAPQKGVNIVRMSDGTARKVVVK